MSILKLIIPALLLSASCNPFFQKEQRLDINTLYHAERIYPTKFGYHLLELMEDTADIESPRYLYLYDKNYILVDKVRLYGTVQEAFKDKLEINEDMSGRTGAGNIGNLDIDYKPILSVSMGGFIAGSFIVDSLKFNKRDLTISIVAGKLNGIEPKMSVFTVPEILTIPMMEIDFNPNYKNGFSITGWDKKGMYNSTRQFFTRDSTAIHNFFLTIEKNGL